MLPRTVVAYGKQAFIIPHRFEDTAIDTLYTMNSDGTMYGFSYGHIKEKFEGLSMAAVAPLLLRVTYVCAP